MLAFLQAGLAENYLVVAVGAVGQDFERVQFV
jgi:hypothetical protein